ncbi:transcriptional regulator [Streptomyces sp. NPDC001941]|uniref:transcriptional regulator n=1 Tax=Streptomyces sp. NPDC001941 TaxID=3154659 RepID=UPI00331B5B07
MPERTIEFGKYGASGVKGSDLVGRRLDDLATGIATPVTQKRGLDARLRYLTKSPRALAAARAAGLTVTDRTLRAWTTGTRKPNARSLEQIEAAYRTVRRHNVAAHLLRRLNARGGTRVELHPINQAAVGRRFQRVLEYRSLNVRRWDRIVEAWRDQDDSALADAWENEIVDLGSQWGQYEYATNVGFSA